MRQRKQRQRQPRRKRKRSISDAVESMAALGKPEDLIAFETGLNKNTLRRRHIADIARGKAAKVQAANLSREEKCACDSILSSFDSKWNTPEHGNLLWRGLGDSGARDPAEAFAAWALAGSKFICTGSNDDFSVERLQQFAAVKAAALKLLAQNGTGNR
jgi:hypothetical protein